MPTYEYECGSCHHRFDVFQGINAKPLRKCPSCGRRSLKKLIGAGSALLFKGPGFYATDYRSSEYKKQAKAESGSSSKSSGGGDKKKDD